MLRAGAKTAKESFEWICLGGKGLPGLGQANLRGQNFIVMKLNDRSATGEPYEHVAKHQIIWSAVKMTHTLQEIQENNLHKR